MIPEPLYKQIMENVPILCVDLLVKNGDKILLLKRKNKPLKGYWWIPGGRVYKNETLLEAVKRKYFEECGLKTDSVKEIGTYDYIGSDAVFDDIKTGIHTLSVVFEIKATSDKIKVDEQHAEYGWFEFEDCPKELKEILNRLINK
ncbi:MAG: NUDIX domain-containing protein [archaeon]